MAGLSDANISWWIRSGGGARPRARLVCFPFAGGSASVFTRWHKYLPADIEVLAMQPPGRESRHRETPYRTISAMVPPLVDALGPMLDRPCFFFGYSLGGLVAYETVRQLRRLNLSLPRRLFVAASSSPQSEHARRPPIHLRTDAEFLDELRRFAGTPDAVLQNPELLNFLLPMLRADFAMLETYVAAPEPPLPVPIIAFGGIDDREVSPEQLAGWSEQTSSGYSQRFFPGDHFFFKTSLEPLLAHVGREVESAA